MAFGQDQVALSGEGRYVTSGMGAEGLVVRAHEQQVPGRSMGDDHDVAITHRWQLDGPDYGFTLGEGG